MEEKKEIKLDLKSIGKAASALKTLSDSLKECQEQMKQIKEDNVSTVEGILNIAITAYDVCDAFNVLKDMVKGIHKNLAQNTDIKFMENSKSP